MHTDRKLLEWAAKAAGIVVVPYIWGKGTGWDHEGFTVAGEGPNEWSPLEDDGDALRLAVKLGLVIDCSRPSAGQPFKAQHFGQEDFKDIGAATRRAITRAAAQIGESMK